ncbi:MAG: cell division protein FtsB [Xanthomonadales bacterium]|jgi:cell division protein FtsB|nr:cell division protein FtsB [Xanthomonadales bacterium]MCX7050666.1 cell division protein FtsB [Pseudomonadota bacterium]
MKWYAGILLVAALALNFRIWVSDDGLSEVRRLERAVAAQQSTNASLVRRNDQLAAEVADLKSGLVAVEERARSELGMIGPNETFYQVVTKVAPPSPSNSPSPETVPVPQGAPAGAERTRTAQR